MKKTAWKIALLLALVGLGACGFQKKGSTAKPIVIEPKEALPLAPAPEPEPEPVIERVPPESMPESAPSEVPAGIPEQESGY